ncbi:MAG: hypothetical protein QXN08_06055 [Nitrososphaerales archaeon]
MLQHTVKQLRDLVIGKNVIAMCIGSDFGDDIAGTLFYKLTHKHLSNIKIIFCGTTPEKFLTEVKGLKPNLVLMINAIDRSLKPGTVVVEDLLEQHSESLLAHNLPLSLIAHILSSELNDCLFRLIGIQAAKAYGSPSKPVVQSVKNLAKVILEFDKYAKGGSSFEQRS